MAVKELLKSHTSEPGRPSHAYRRPVFLIVAAILVTFGMQWIWPAHISIYIPTSSTTHSKSFLWEDISPSTSLEYHPCFNGFQCARLEVPLNWNETIDGESDKAAIAIIKKPARVEITDPRYGGVILFNPGGPGGSGVSFLLHVGPNLQTLLDSPFLSETELHPSQENEKYFDVLSWDPRGVNNTTPSHGCIEDPVARSTWTAQDAAIGFSLDDDEVFRNVWSRGRLLGRTCANVDAQSTQNRVNGHEQLAQYVSTANVVRDMVEIIERHGEWREKEARALLSRSCQDEEKVDKVLARSAWRKGEEPLQYWGFSYGTVIGQTFASMQPHRVQRMVVDGVVDAEDYARNGWLKNLQDVDKITSAFATTCFDAGSSRCDLYDQAGPDAIFERFNEVLENIKSDPVPALYNGVPSIVTHSDVILYIFANWYAPLFGFPAVANAMHQLSNGNGTYFAALKSQSISHTCDLPSKAEKDTSSAGLAILCTDGGPHSSDLRTQDQYHAYVDALRSQSSLFGEGWSRVRLPCASFDVRAKWRFEGPFGAQTAHPIIFASQSLDPVTPLANAFLGTQLFPGSVAIETLGQGHCTLAMPSVEGMLALRTYFHTGEVPENGTKYDVAVGPFGGDRQEDRKWTREEREVLEASRSVAEMFYDMVKTNWEHGNG
ncbi:hypothetical protein MMC13_003129 [Lambiella insularis]|nr:hypothetical protein [Lambiella insularis]